MFWSSKKQNKTEKALTELIQYCGKVTRDLGHQVKMLDLLNAKFLRLQERICDIESKLSGAKVEETSRNAPKQNDTTTGYKAYRKRRELREWKDRKGFIVRKAGTKRIRLPSDETHEGKVYNTFADLLKDIGCDQISYVRHAERMERLLFHHTAWEVVELFKRESEYRKKVLMR